MRKLSSIFFIVFYSLIATGFSVNLHYCLDELAGIGVFGEENKCCCGENEDISRCCDNETIALDAVEELIPTVNNVEVALEATVAEVLTSIDPVLTLVKDQMIRASDSSPPDKQPLWLLNCKLILYG